jgi:hypothetical protein
LRWKLLREDPDDDPDDEYGLSDTSDPAAGGHTVQR